MIIRFPARSYSSVAVTAALLICSAGKSHSADLWDIYQLALANDPIYQAESLGHDASILDLPISKTAFRPSVTASGGLGRERTDITGPTETNDARFD